MKYMDLNEDVNNIDINEVRVVEFNNNEYMCGLVYDYKTKKFLGVFYVEDADEFVTEIIRDIKLNKTIIPKNLIEYRKNNPDFKILSLSYHKAGGNSGKNTMKTSLYIPSSWAKELGVNMEDNKVDVKFIGDAIIITKHKDI